MTVGYYVQAAMGGGPHGTIKYHFSTREDAEAEAVRLSSEAEATVFDIVEYDQFETERLVGAAHQGVLKQMGT